VEVVPARTVLLDLDGTLLDSATGITEHLSSAMDAVGAGRHPPNTLRGYIGPPFEAFMPGLGLDPAQILAATAEYRRTYDPLAASLSQPYPGIRELLGCLRDNNFRLAIATSKPESLARVILSGNGLDRYFEVIGGAEHLRGRSGKAAVVGSVIDRLGVLPTGGAERPTASEGRAGPDRSPIMVGDRMHDVHGAAAHGLATVGVSWGYAEPDELMTAGAVAVVDTPEELGDLLLCHFRRTESESSRAG